MCKPVSAWLKPDGEICHLWQTDDHDAIARVFRLRDDSITREQRAIRIEYSWRDIATIGDLDTWELRVDEDTAPEWATDEVIARARAGMRDIAERMLVRDNRGSLAGGAWIILEGGRIDALIGGRIVAAQKGADLSRSYLSDVNLRGADLSGSNLRGADLRGADLSRSYLSDVNLRGADLSGSNLRGADLSGADLSRSNLRGADLIGSNLSGADLYGADLSRSNLRGADLSRSDLSGSNLSGADLSGADLIGSNLSRSDLSGSNLSGADLIGSNLSGAYLLDTDPIPSDWTRNEDDRLVRIGEKAST